MRDKLDFDGWERYPENLKGSSFRHHEYNLTSYCRQLADDSERLFINTNESISLKLIDLATKGESQILLLDEGHDSDAGQDRGKL